MSDRVQHICGKENVELGELGAGCLLLRPAGLLLRARRQPAGRGSGQHSQ
jgi:hypothetical protein